MREHRRKKEIKEKQGKLRKT